jgi:hypothetical protein
MLNDKKILSISLIIYGLLILVSNTLLAIYFNFPDILRESSKVRFDLFIQNSSIIIPTYYLFLITAFIQTLVPIMFYYVLNRKDLYSAITLCLGVLAGIYQTLGFVRWIVVIPYLGNQSTDVTLLEGFANAYFGMSVGEHLGTLFLGMWLVLLGAQMIENKIFNKLISCIGLISGVGLSIWSFESLGISILGIITLPVWVLFVVWMFILSYSLLTSKENSQNIKWYVWLIALVFYLINVLPAFL